MPLSIPYPLESPYLLLLSLSPWTIRPVGGCAHPQWDLPDTVRLWFSVGAWNGDALLALAFQIWLSVVFDFLSSVLGP